MPLMRHVLTAAIVGVLLCAPTAHADAERRETDSAAGRVATALGAAVARRASEPDIHLAAGVLVKPLDTLTTATDGRAILMFDDRTRVVLGNDTQLLIDAYPPAAGRESDRRLQLTWGAVRVLDASGTRNTVLVRTPSAIVRTVGGYVVIAHDANAGTTRVLTLAGEADVEHASRSNVRFTVAPGEWCVVEQDHLPSIPRTAPPPFAAELLAATHVDESPAADMRPGTSARLGDDPLRDLPIASYGFGGGAASRLGDDAAEFDAYARTERDFERPDIVLPEDTTPDSVRYRHPGEILDDANVHVIIDLGQGRRILKPDKGEKDEEK
ncbi:FecR family protein [bacterium]|nr:FecR family protein [bacterium]